MLNAGDKIQFKGPSFFEDKVWSNGILESELTTSYSAACQGYDVRDEFGVKYFVYENSVRIPL